MSSPIRFGSTKKRVAVLLALGCAGAAAKCDYPWLQFGGGPTHTSNNTQETTIGIGNVASLHRLWQATLPATGDGAPAVALGVMTPSGQVDLVLVTTRAGDIVATNAATGARVWSRSFPAGTCRINNGSSICYTTSSAAVDPSGANFVYSYGLDGRVHKIALADGSEVTGGGWPEVVTLKAYDEKGSSALSTAVAANGVPYLYVVTSGYPGDFGNYQGHLVAINLSDGSQKVFNTVCSNQAVHFVAPPGSPNCGTVRSGMWARAGTIYDADNDRLYISTGNGPYAPASHNWGDSVVALRPDGSPANANGDPLDAYTPTNFATLESLDADLGSTLPAVIPPIPNSRIPHLGVMGGKDAKLRLLNMDNLSGRGGPGFTGGEVGTIINVPQGGQVLTQPAVWTNPADNAVWIFVANGSGTSGIQVVVDGAGNPSLSTKWTIGTSGTSPLVANGVLYFANGNRVGAYNPTTGANLWQDTSLGSVHWQSPVVASGKLFMQDGSGHLNAYGI